MLMTVLGSAAAAVERCAAIEQELYESQVGSRCKTLYASKTSKSSSPLHAGHSAISSKLRSFFQDLWSAISGSTDSISFLTCRAFLFRARFSCKARKSISRFS